MLAACGLDTLPIGMGLALVVAGGVPGMGTRLLLLLLLALGGSEIERRRSEDIVLSIGLGISCVAAAGVVGKDANGFLKVGVSCNEPNEG